MPGIPTHFVILDRTITALQGSADAKVAAIGNVLAKNKPYAYLGAVGPALADFMPSDPEAPGSPRGSQYMRIWMAILSVVGGDGTSANPGLFSVIENMTQILDKLTAIANSEDLQALEGVQGEVGTINQTADALHAIVQSIPSVAIQISSSIGVGMKPAIISSPTGQPPPPPSLWAVRDFLCWKHPGRFAQALINKANASGDDRFIAYAYGWLIGYTGMVVGSPFLNSIVGGPYRNQWWRNRWVANYVDTWAWGAYGAGATMAGDTPTPPYDTWPNLCNANLHQWIDLGGIDPVDVMKRLRQGSALPDILPGAFCKFWVEAYSDAYGALPQGSPVTSSAVNGAYVMTWMALWFQTSGSVLGCNPSPPMAPGDDCGKAPSWSNPSRPGDNGKGSTPPSPHVDHDPDVGQIVSGIVLALLGVAAFCVGGMAAGAAAIAAGVDVIIHGASEINWSKLRCDLYWYRLYLYNGLKALHEILELGAFAYPFAKELANDTTTIQLLGTTYKFDSGRALVKSKIDERYPAPPWSGVISTWVQQPSGIETEPTFGYRSVAYPFFFVDDNIENPLSNGRVAVDGNWPFTPLPASSEPVQFGNAVANCVDLIANMPKVLPDWNLDADRGLAWHTWQLTGPYADPVPTGPEP